MLVGISAPSVYAQFYDDCLDEVEDLCSGGANNQAPLILVQIALDGNTDAVGAGACLNTPLGSVQGEGCIDIVTGNQGFSESEATLRIANATLGSANVAEPPRYIAVQAYIHGQYPFQIGDSSVSAYPIAGPRLYYWDPESCEDKPVVCEDTEVSFGLDMGVGARYGPVRCEVFTGLGGVPSISARLKLVLFQL